MADKTYPIGTKIRYTGYCKACKNKIGEIVEIRRNTYYITLPKSTCSAMKNMGKLMCNWSDVELAVRKNEQLLFAFME